MRWTAGRLDGWTARAFRCALVVAIVFASQAVQPSSRLAAQAPQTPELIDRVVAVVGNQPILMSEVNEKLQQARSQGMQIPEGDSAAIATLQRQFLTAMIEDEVIYQEARRDTSITVTDVEVQAAVDQQYRNVRAQFRSDQELQAALQGAGLGTLEEYRRYLAEQSRRQNYGQRFVQKMQQSGMMRAGTISDDEMREFFEQALRANQLDSLPPTISFRQIVVSPKPSDSSRVQAFRLADSLRTAIERGADFATVARQFSEDGSKDNGGDLGFFRRGTMVRQFEEVAFNLRPGVVSPVVRTEFGFHLILVDRVQTGEIKARHILIIPKVTAADQAAARLLADSLARLVRAGTNLDSLQRIYGDSSEPKSVGPTNRDSLPAAYAQAMAEVHAGDIVGPAPLNPDPPERTRWIIARVADVQPKRMPTFTDVRDQVRARLIEQKGYRNLIEDLKRKTYVDIRL